MRGAAERHDVWQFDDEEGVALAPDELVVVVTRDELGLMASVIGEALQAVEEWEFQTRLGQTRQESWALIADD
jgi:hypothetical protein